MATNQTSITGPKMPPMNEVPYKQQNQDSHRQRHDHVFRLRRINLEAFDRAQNGNRRRDCAIAIEERGAE
jgi:hypothetical protein